MTLSAGSATRIIDGRIGDDLLGQCFRRPAERVRDHLEANALFLADGSESVLLIGLDLLGFFPPGYVERVKADIAARTGVPALRVIVSSTHTHDGPVTMPMLHDAPADEAYLASLGGWIADAAEESVRGARPARVGWGLGRAHVGYNRRLCWADGRHTMYGDPRRADFTGFEGPDDPSHAVLYAADADGRYIGIVHNNCCHTTCIEGATAFSADFPGEARSRLREILAAPVPVLYLQGASGDTSPWNLLSPAPRDGERRLREVGAALASETARILASTTPADSVRIRHARAELPARIRLPSEAELKRALEVEAIGPAKADRWEYVMLVDGVLRMYRLYKDNPTEVLSLNAVRIGDLGIATNPCEFFCQFGLDIKRRSPAAATMVSQLTDGFAGYCYTHYAHLGGGYSADPTPWCRLAPETGYRIVDTCSRLLHELWDGGSAGR